jgi:hypothetical protein
MFNRLGKRKLILDGKTTGEAQWGKDNDSVSAVDINLYWPVYDQIIHDAKVPFHHYFLISAQETTKKNAATG